MCPELLSVPAEAIVAALRFLTEAAPRRWTSRACSGAGRACSGGRLGHTDAAAEQLKLEAAGSCSSSLGQRPCPALAAELVARGRLRRRLICPLDSSTGDLPCRARIHGGEEMKPAPLCPPTSSRSTAVSPSSARTRRARTPPQRFDVPSAPLPPPHPPPWRAQARRRRRRPALGQGSGSGTRPLPCSRASSLPHARSAARRAGGCTAPASMGSLVRRRRGEQGTAPLRPRPTPYRPLLLDGLAAGVANRARIGSGDGGGGRRGDGELQKGSGDAAGAKDDSELEVGGGDWRRLKLQLHAPSAPSAGGGHGAAVLPPAAVELQPRWGAAGGPPSGRQAASPTWRKVVGATTSGHGGPSRSPLHSSRSKGTGARRDFGVVPAVARCGALSGIRPRHADRGIFAGPRCG
jgi:hypothetical protein